MARRLFFVDGVHSGRAAITGDDAQHLTRVLRVEAGQRYELSDGSQRYLAEVESARKSEVVFAILEKLASPAMPVRIHLVAAIVKFDRFEWTLEKAAELGVESVTLIIAERTQEGLDRAAVKRMERWEKILRESCQQSRRTTVPALQPPVAFRKSLDQPGVKLFLDEAPDAPPILSAAPGADEVSVMVGPEGGWVDHERRAAIDAGWLPVSLGPTILRAETAAIAALAVVWAAATSPKR